MNVALDRFGACLCGRPLSAHRGRRNQSISCEQLAEAEQGREAAASCTTRFSALAAVERRETNRNIERVR